MAGFAGSLPPCARRYILLQRHNINIHRNEITNAGMAIVVSTGAPGAVLDNVQIHDNLIHDLSSKIGDWVHGDGIHVWGGKDDQHDVGREERGFRSWSVVKYCERFVPAYLQGEADCKPEIGGREETADPWQSRARRAQPLATLSIGTMVHGRLPMIRNAAPQHLAKDTLDPSPRAQMLNG